ncbi:hypothetical protein B0H14DRAFT_2732653 [Mycena olivaceomarginata]|nr:hypothetical protein B0H14DRAFT_2732653 [Mycena olivaceomarginata]
MQLLLLKYSSSHSRSPQATSVQSRLILRLCRRFHCVCLRFFRYCLETGFMLNTHCMHLHTLLPETTQHSENRMYCSSSTEWRRGVIVSVSLALGATGEIALTSMQIPLRYLITFSVFDISATFSSIPPPSMGTFTVRSPAANQLFAFHGTSH